MIIVWLDKEARAKTRVHIAMRDSLLRQLVCIAIANAEYLHYNLSRGSSPLVKRDGEESYSTPLTEQENFFSVEVELGTPSQKQVLLLDTGSSDMIVLSDSNPFCSSSTVCSKYGSFNKDSSSSYTSRDKSFKINYADDTSSAGVWASDVVELDGNSMDLTFGLATDSNSIGVLGIGLPGLEVSSGSTSGSFSYNNFPMQLKSSGIIESVLYSMSLNSDKNTGDLLFGAVDTSKYNSGEIFSLPMINRYAKQGYSHPIKLEVTLQGIGKYDGNTDEQTTYTTTKMPALIDSGSTIVYLPNNVATLVLNEVGAVEDGDHYSVPCSLATDGNMMNKNIVFDFGGFHINIPFNVFVLTNSMDTSDGLCTFGVMGQNKNTVTLGDSFLTSAYVVFDLENYEISIGQHVSGDGNIEVVSNGEIPGVKKAPGYDDIWTEDESVSIGGNIFTLDSVTSSFSTALSSSTAVSSSHTSSSVTTTTTTTSVYTAPSSSTKRISSSHSSSTKKSSSSRTTTTSKTSSNKKSSTSKTSSSEKHTTSKTHSSKTTKSSTSHSKIKYTSSVEHTQSKITHTSDTRHNSTSSHLITSSTTNDTTMIKYSTSSTHNSTIGSTHPMSSSITGDNNNIHNLNEMTSTTLLSSSSSTYSTASSQQKKKNNGIALRDTLISPTNLMTYLMFFIYYLF